MDGKEIMTEEEKEFWEKEGNYWNEHCFTCGHKITPMEPCIFSWEWDAWICDSCYDRIKKNENLSQEEKIIYEEFFEKR